MFQLSFLRDPDESPRTTAAIPNIILASLIVNLRVKPRYVLIHHMYLILRVPANHPPVLLETVTAVDRRLTLLDHQLVYLPALPLQLRRLPPPHPPLPTPLPHLVQILPLLHLPRPLALLEGRLPRTRLGTRSGLTRHAGLLQRTLPLRKVLVVTLYALGDPWIMDGVQVMIFLVIILEVILS
jgi:hypothetical protein